MDAQGNLDLHYAVRNSLGDTGRGHRSYRPGDPGYDDLLRALGPLSPGQSRPYSSRIHGDPPPLTCATTT